MSKLNKVHGIDLKSVSTESPNKRNSNSSEQEDENLLMVMKNLLKMRSSSNWLIGCKLLSKCIENRLLYLDLFICNCESISIYYFLICLRNSVQAILPQKAPRRKNTPRKPSEAPSSTSKSTSSWTKLKSQNTNNNFHFKFVTNQMTIGPSWPMSQAVLSAPAKSKSKNSGLWGNKWSSWLGKKFLVVNWIWLKSVSRLRRVQIRQPWGILSITVWFSLTSWTWQPRKKILWRDSSWRWPQFYRPLITLTCFSNP